MTSLVPNRFLFRFEVPIFRWSGAVRIDADLDKWEPRFRLPKLHALDDSPDYADISVAWHDEGLLLAARIRGKRLPSQGDPLRFRQSDHVRLLTDLRDAREIRRATRFCQQFYFLPTGGGKGGREPVAGGAAIARAKDDAPIAKAGSLPIAARLLRDGYALEALVPARVLAGWDPANQPRIGLFVIVEDREMRQQSLTIGDDLNWWCDPSTWVTGVLTDS